MTTRSHAGFLVFLRKEIAASFNERATYGA